MEQDRSWIKIMEQDRSWIMDHIDLSVILRLFVFKQKDPHGKWKYTSIFFVTL